MTARRSRGDGGLHWDEKRQRWIATAHLGFDASGKRIVRRGSGKTKTEAKSRLKEVLRDHEDDLAIAPTNYSVENAVNDWLMYGLAGRDAGTAGTYTSLSQIHIIPCPGSRKLRDLSAEEVDKWLTQKAKTLNTVFLKGVPDADPPVPPRIAVWRSVRSTGDTKTRKSLRTIALPTRCVDALWQQFEDQGWDRLAADDQRAETGLVFSSAVGTALDSTNVRRAFRQAITYAGGIEAKEWTPRELRHSFVSLLSDQEVPLEEISRLVGHSGTAVTEAVYRKQIRPVIQTGATVTDGIFKEDPKP
ncbi:tyrosine-type recombinase/integrase [Streptomyces sp. NPDC059389]|uniref:tyrosine-type recombinase/integrase n=1 Tax=Streptomyces sp. NPDC059389 TaxID=3346818 RepID=UPI0036B71918